MKPKKFSSTSKIATNCHLATSQKLAPKQKDVAASPASSSATARRTPPIKGFVAHVCAGCNKPIKRDKFLLRACEKYWHENCLKCDRCQNRLGELGSTLYCKSNMNLCRDDYLELYGETGVCSVCSKLIRASEMVMRAKQNVYHLECFACQLCNQRFCVGDRFYLCENKVVCEFDYEEHVLPIQRSLIQTTIEHQHQQQQQQQERDATGYLAPMPTDRDHIEPMDDRESSAAGDDNARLEQRLDGSQVSAEPPMP